MAVLLDTNVVSELLRPSPVPTVESWIAERPAAELHLSAVGEAELRCTGRKAPSLRPRTVRTSGPTQYVCVASRVCLARRDARPLRFGRTARGRVAGGETMRGRGAREVSMFVAVRARLGRRSHGAGVRPATCALGAVVSGRWGQRGRPVRRAGAERVDESVGCDGIEAVSGDPPRAILLTITVDIASKAVNVHCAHACDRPARVARDAPLAVTQPVERRAHSVTPATPARAADRVE